MISILFEIRRWSDYETQQNRANRDEPLAISHAFEKKSKDLVRMLPSKPGGLSRKEMKGLKHSDLFMGKAVEQTSKAIKKVAPKRKIYPPYIGPERRKANLPRFKKAA
jgi:hypothetical protein